MYVIGRKAKETLYYGLDREEWARRSFEKSQALLSSRHIVFLDGGP